MIVTPYREDPFLSLHSIHNFDEFFTIIRAELNIAVHAKPVTVRAVGVGNPQQFLSLSIPLDGMDPLDALQAIARPQQEYFYWENGHTGEAIAAIGSTAQMTLSGHRRFDDSKHYVHQIFENTLPIGNLSNPFSGPRVFCRFTFFDTVNLGSLFSPATLVLPQWQIATDGESGSFVANIPLTINHALRESCMTIWDTVSRLRTMARSSHASDLWRQKRWNGKGRRSASNLITRSFGENQAGSDQASPTRAGARHGIPTRHRAPALPKLPHTAQTQFVQTVASVLNTIDGCAPLNKVVLAHALDVPLEAPIDGLSSLYTLRQNHSDCYLFSTQNAQGQTFLCASPEKLLSIQGGCLATEAIAGSIPRGKTPSDDARYANTLLHDRKELHEHQLVVDFISQRLAHLGLETQRSIRPSLLPLSTIQHLRTPIYADIPPTLHPLDLVATLHPTPAVAGVPREMACDLIQQHEAFERSLYAAPMGWIDYQGDSEFLVGIRSALLDGTQARLYAGAGIVQGSDPQRELDEIELKLRALYSALIQPGS